MKAQDNNYVIVENLRELLRTIDPEKPLLIGRQMKVWLTSYVFSIDVGLSYLELVLIIFLEYLGKRWQHLHVGRSWLCNL